MLKSVICLFLVVMSMLAGLSGFLAFLVLGNYPGAVWACATGIVSGFTVHLRLLECKNNLNEWYSTRELSPLSLIGFICFTLGIMGLSYHTAIEVMRKEPILPIPQSEIIPIVWAALTAKSGVVLMCTAKSYSKMDRDRDGLLSSSESNPECENIPADARA